LNKKTLKKLLTLRKNLSDYYYRKSKTIMTKAEKIAHLTKQLNEWTAMLHKSRKHSLMCMRATHVSYLQNELEKLKES
tara:strand:+ start:87 stop:320 length:234 start_codon:yes stop_codon:yes gene_type:complete